jgi:hypothetical protein
MKNITTMLEQFQKNLDSPEGQARLDAIIAKSKERIRLNLEFFESVKFNELLSRFSASSDMQISCGDWSYGATNELLSEGEYHSLFDSIWATLHDMIIVDEESDFHTKELVYGEFLLSLTDGQGTITSIRKILKPCS